MAIPIKYKDTLDNLIDNSDPEFLDWPKSINKGLRDVFRSAGNWTGLSGGSCLDKDVLNG